MCECVCVYVSGLGGIEWFKLVEWKTTTLIRVTIVLLLYISIGPTQCRVIIKYLL